MRRLGAVLALLACTAFGAARAEAPPAVVLQHAPGVEMRGSGTLRWLGLRIYDAVLWAAPARPAGTNGTTGTTGTTVADFDYTRPFALQLRYARSLKGAAIADRSVEEITRLGLGSPAQRAQWGAAMRRLFPDVVDGTTLAGVHLPGRGARFYLNGQPLGEIADPAFSQAFFAIWLDAKTSAPELRSALLGAS
ncbi:MAG: chalcone isomerase family protein [Betaproteobacteria bacterium]|nr:chalcone isomerase family protein [Betaproteobacteria bacterium]